MSLIVQKFGGTSVATSEHIRRVAARIASAHRSGHRVIAVVSAMGAMTDDLGDLAYGISPNPPAREMDMLLTAGERISMALLAIALDVEQVEAISLTGSQAGILTVGDHGAAEIQDVRSFRVDEGLDQNRVVIVAGFQGVDPDSKDVTTLGRGGSDVTAVALAAAHGAEVCEFYKDVDGIFTADPSLVSEATLLKEISYDDMAGFAAGGSGVLVESAVDMARRSQVPIHIRSSFHEGGGTWLRGDTPVGRLVCGIAHDGAVARFTAPVTALRSARGLVDQLSDTGVGVDVALLRQSDTELSVVVPDSQVKPAEDLLTRAAGDGLVEVEHGLAKLSVVGRAAPESDEIHAAVRDALTEAGISIFSSGTAPHRLTLLIEQSDLGHAANMVHSRLEPPIQEP